MAPRRSRAKQIEERLHIMEDRSGQLLKTFISQEVKRQMQLIVRQIHQGPSNPMVTGSSGQQSSCASVSPPEMDWAHHPVDDITAQQPCQLHVQVCNISIKVALGMAYPVEPKQLFHGRKILPGYSRVRLDEVCAGLGDLDLVYTGYEGVAKLEEAIHKVILWHKRYIIFGTNCNNKSSSTPRNLPHSGRNRIPTAPPVPHKENLQSPRSKELVVAAHHDAQCDEDDASSDNQDHDHFDEDENMLVHRHTAAPSVRAINITTTQNDDAPLSAHDTLVGKGVILYAMLRSDLPVAKGTVVSTNPSTMLGGQPLGRQFCEVVVNLVLKRDAFLPRPYAEIETMADAYMMSIAWPYKKLKVSRTASRLSQGTAGTYRRWYRENLLTAS